MSTRKDPYRADVVCKGCGITFESHQRNRLYCCFSCNIDFRIAKLGQCSYCHEELPFEERIFIGNDAPGTPLGDFPAKHQACRAKYLDEVGRDDDCRCAECKKRRGDTSSITGQDSNRRPTFHGRHRQAVLERDNYVCQICGLPTDSTVSPADDRYPTLDHIVRVVDGGDDEIDNLRNAHKWCNTTISATAYGEDWVRQRARAKFGKN